jgi:perosamine synthetase
VETPRWVIWAGYWRFGWPMHRQPVFKKMGLFKDEYCPVAEKIAKRGFYIPSGLGLNQRQVERVAASLKDIL